MKSHTVEWKKRFANHMSDKGLIFNICKGLIKLIAKIPSDFKLNRKTEYTFFFKEDIHVTNRYMNMCSTPLIIKEMQMKITMKYHLIPTTIV